MTLAEIGDILQKLEVNLTNDYSFQPSNVYQTGNPANRKIIGEFIDRYLLPGSRIENVGAYKELVLRSRAGESCLLLAEHYGNFDFPVLYRLTEKNPELGLESSSCLLPIRAMKLSEFAPVTAVFTRSYDTLMIYPSRALDKITDEAELAEVRKISVPINHAAIREMISRKHQGNIFVVFPTGTRYRPWDPDTRRGVREIYSYVKTFDNVMFVSINGNSLPPNRTEDMSQDLPIKDLMIYTCSEIVNGKQFQKEMAAFTPPGKDPKRHVVDCVMEKLASMHDAMEPTWLREKSAF